MDGCQMIRQKDILFSHLSDGTQDVVFQRCLKTMLTFNLVLFYNDEKLEAHIQQQMVG